MQRKQGQPSTEAAMRKPWLKFYPSDWRGDPKLRMCGLAARGLWIEMIGVMHEAQPYGHLLIAGERPTDTQLAVLAGAATEQIPELIRELEQAIANGQGEGDPAGNRAGDSGPGSAAPSP